MLIANFAQVWPTNRLPLSPAGTIHHADRCGIIFPKLRCIDFVFSELTESAKDRNRLRAWSDGIFIIPFGKESLSPVTREEFNELNRIGFVWS